MLEMLVLFFMIIIVGVSSINTTCVNDSDCFATDRCLGSECSNSECICSDKCYLHPGDGHPNNASECVELPGLGQNCSVAQQCNNLFLSCESDVCICVYDAYCWENEVDRGGFQRVVQGILAWALMLTATALMIMYYKTCRRNARARRERDERAMAAPDTASFFSPNSLQRLSAQLRDRPPPYDPSLMAPWKTTSEMSEPPPPYLDIMDISEIQDERSNPIFILSDYNLILSSQSPPPYESTNINFQCSVNGNNNSSSNNNNEHINIGNNHNNANCTISDNNKNCVHDVTVPTTDPLPVTATDHHGPTSHQAVYREQVRFVRNTFRSSEREIHTQDTAAGVTCPETHSYI